MFDEYYDEHYGLDGRDVQVSDCSGCLWGVLLFVVAVMVLGLVLT